MSKHITELYNNYLDITRKAADLQNAAAVLGWDQEVYMPEKGFAFRGRQLATLSMMAHELVTSAEYGDILYRLRDMNGLSGDEADNVRLSFEDYEKNKKLPPAFVQQIAEQSSNSYNAWIQARKENSFGIYAPELERMVSLKKRQADLYGFDGHPYDALLDDYEKGATVAMLDPVFNMVKERLLPLLEEITTAAQVNDSFLFKHYAKNDQWEFSLQVLKAMGYDFEAGRQDMSEHPFTTSFSPADVRITTRVNEKDFSSLLWSSVHEGGHALYEQGLPAEQYGLPLGAPASLSIHESQSRLWENCVARGYQFWKHFYPLLQEHFPRQLFDVTLEDFYKGINKVQPSLVRTESDELTYHFHVLIRYEIEKRLIDGSLAVADLPAAWNDMYQKYLGVMPPDDKSGVLQDVHWSHGSFGYFPTYSLGSFYAAQFFEQAQKDDRDIVNKMSKGDCSNLHAWLLNKVYAHGRRYRSDELCKNITGKGLDFSAFMRYANSKYRYIYGLS